MPRGRGGPRTGAIGTAYGNRTDLNAHLPIEAAPNQTYGEATDQRNAQRVVPMATAPTPVPPVAAPTTVSGQLPDNAPAFTKPGSLPYLQPTERPDEPTTAGSALGPGPGPEVLSAGPQRPVAEMLNGLASAPGASPMLMDLAAAARNLGL